MGITLVLLLLLMLLSGCGAPAAAKADPNVVDGVRIAEEDGTPVTGSRSAAPRILQPAQDGTVIYGNDDTEIDASHLTDGYISVRYPGEASKVKLQITSEDQLTYTYNLPVDGQYYVFPFSAGDGHYTIGIYSNIEATMYAEVYSTGLDVRLSDPFGPFLYPNQYVWFTDDTGAVALGEELCTPANRDLDCVTLIYNYVISHIEYDWDEAESVQNGYLPDVDEVLETGKGICFDYAALMSSMLRTQRIPTRLEIGYAGTAYHAWISCYLEDTGWVNGIIEFDGEEWSMMDPTFASNQSEKELKKFIGDGSNYRRVYMY